MTNKIKINWTEYLNWSAKTTMRAVASAAYNYPEIVDIRSRNDDGSITVIVGRNDAGTLLVTTVDATSEFVTEIAEPETKTTVCVNTDERYGDAYPVTIADYIELNPDGNFEQRSDGIYEDGEQIAEVQTI